LIFVKGFAMSAPAPLRHHFNNLHMSKVIKTTIRIEAAPAKVWQILTQFEQYPEWNTFMPGITGRPEVGSRLKVRIAPPDANAMTFTPTVLEVQPDKRLRWLGHLLIRGLFDGEHQFELLENADGSTTFIHAETFRGVLVPLFSKMLDNNTMRGFNLMNQQLKARVEGASRML
jgi:hypothetical protein